YDKIKPKGKCSNRDCHTRVSPLITALFSGSIKCEKLQKESNRAKNDATEAKKEAVSANEQNKVLIKS
ncbi:Chromosome partition protein MukB, partial [Bienertia sinuspersici]